MKTDEQYKVLEQALLDYIERYGLTDKARNYFAQVERGAADQSSKPSDPLSARTADHPA